MTIWNRSDSNHSDFTCDPYINSLVALDFLGKTRKSLKITRNFSAANPKSLENEQKYFQESKEITEGKKNKSKKQGKGNQGSRRFRGNLAASCDFFSQAFFDEVWGSNPRPYGLAPQATALDRSAKLSGVLGCQIARYMTPCQVVAIAIQGSLHQIGKLNLHTSIPRVRDPI